MILFAALLVLISVISLIWVIVHDGYGSRPIPRSHHHDLAPVPYYSQRPVS